MNENWPRWTFASFAKHFDSLKQTIPLYIEGTDRDTSTLKDFAEFRIDGPRIKQVSRRIWTLEVTVNILLQSVMDDKDAYKLHKNEGIILAAFTPVVIGYEYGTPGSGDQFACFERESGSGNILGFDVRINQFGIIDTEVRKQQATIEAGYRATLEL